MIALLGWAVAAAGLLASVRLRRELGRRAALAAAACHEIRGPLTAARLGLHLAGREDDHPGPLSVVDGELVRAARAVADLEAAARGRRDRDRPRLVDLGALVADAARAATPVARRHGADLSLGPLAAGAWVRGDPLRLAQACHNLLVNAAEHGGGRVKVAVRRQGRRLLLAVEDEGPGFPGPGGRVRPRAGLGSRGHGLAVAAHVAERHGGRLATGPAPRGARVTLDLPAARP